MSAALTLLAKQRGGPKLVAQVLFYPVTDANFDTGSYTQFAEGYFLRREGMQWFWDQYTTDQDQRDEITASPLRASLEQLAGLPPALVITAEADVLRDEGEAYAAKLRAGRGAVTAVRYGGIIHDFVMLNALPETPPPGCDQPGDQRPARGTRHQALMKDAVRPAGPSATGRTANEQPSSTARTEPSSSRPWST